MPDVALRELKIQTELIHHVFMRTYPFVFCNALIALLLLALAWPPQAPVVGAGWLVVLYAALGCHYLIYVSFIRAASHGLDVTPYLTKLQWTALAVGIAWAAAPWLFIHAHTPLAWLATAAAMLSLAALALVTLAPSINAFYAVTVPPLGICLLLLGLQHDLLAIAIATMLGLACGAILPLGHREHLLLRGLTAEALANATHRNNIAELQNVLTATLDSVTQGICTSTRDGAIASINQRFIQLLDVKPNQLVGSSLSTLLATIAPPLAGALHTRMEYTTPAGRVVELRPNAAGAAVRVITATDITERRRGDRTWPPARRATD